MTTPEERTALALERIVALLEARLGMPAPPIHVPAPPAPVEPPAPPRAQAFVAQAPAPVQLATDICPVHNVEFKTTRQDGTKYKRAFCSQKNPDGSYCNQKGAWLG